MRSPVWIKSLAWGCGCLACHILNLILALFAMAQVGLLVLNIVQQEVPLPDKLTTWVLNQASPAGLEAEWENSVFDLRAGVLLSRFTLKDASTDQIIATAEESHVQLSPLHLILPRLFPLRSIEGRGVQIYVPVSHSLSGLNEPVLNIKHVAIHEEEGELIIPSLMIETGGISLHLNGSAPLHLLAQQSGDGPKSNPYELLKSLHRITREISGFAEVSWKLLPSGHHLFRVSGLMPALDYSRARLSALSGDAIISFSKEGLAVHDFRLDGFLSLREEIPQLPLVNRLLHLDPIPFHLSADGPPKRDILAILPTRIRLNLHPRDDSLPFHHLLLETNRTGETSPVHWVASSPRAFSEGWAFPLPADPDVDNTGFPFKLSFRGYLPNFSLETLIPGLPENRLLAGTHADQIQLNATFDPLSESLEGNIAGDGLNIGQTDFSRLHTRIQLNAESLKLDNIHVKRSSDETARGSYHHHFKSSKFSLNAAGSIFPTSLDIILGRWWTRIFRNIEAHEPLPADVSVWGCWRDITSLQSVTSVDGNNGAYRGVDIPRLQLRVRSNRQWAVLEHLKAQFEGGALEGRIAIRSGIPKTAAYRALLLDLESEAPWNALCAASGINKLCDYSFDENPHVTVRGILWQDSGKGFKVQPQANLQLSLLQHGGTGIVEGLEISGLTLSGSLTGSSLNLTGLSGQFAEGIFSGEIGIENWQVPENSQRKYRLQLIDAHYGSAQKQLAEAFSYKPVTEGTVQAGISEGRLDASIELQTGQSLEEAFGNGSVTLRQAKLGEIHLFGGLSRFFSSMGLGFSTLNLDTLGFNWLLQEGILRLNQGLVTGPVLRLQLAGSADLASRQLSMQADVTLVKGMLGMVLTPVSENLQFDLTGSLEDPTWKIRFSPFRWLQESPSARADRSGL